MRAVLLTALLIGCYDTPEPDVPVSDTGPQHKADAYTGSADCLVCGVGYYYALIPGVEATCHELCRYFSDCVSGERCVGSPRICLPGVGRSDVREVLHPWVLCGEEM
jgi:hypothetical protein